MSIHGTWLSVVLVGGLLAASGKAQQVPHADGDLLDEVRRMDLVAAQKVEADLRLALRDVQRLTLSNPCLAVERLKQALAQLEIDKVLSKDRRESLKRMLHDRIRVTELEIAKANETKRETPSAKLRAEEARRTAERQELSRGLKTVKEFQDQGKPEEASRAADELARKHAHKPASQAAAQTAAQADELAKNRKLQKDRERQLLAGYRDIDKSNTLVNGDVEFPKDWKERTKDRTTAIKLTAKEKALLQSLNTPITVSFKNSKLQDVLEYLQTYTGQTILLDEQSLREAEISYDSLVTLNAKGLTLRIVLRKVLADLGLSYVIKDETILATSAQRAKDLMVVRRYYIGDLLAAMGAFGPGNGLPLFPLQGNLQAQAAQTTQTVKQLIEMIETTVDPQGWQTNGGNGTITYHAASMSLIVRQSAEVHALLANSGLSK